MAKSRTSYEPGKSGNPAGRPTRHAVLLALDAIGAEVGTEIMHSVINAARGGDMRAADILLRRLWPERKGRPVQMDLPPITAPSDIVAALGAVTAAVANAEISAEARNLRLTRPFCDPDPASGEDNAHITAARAADGPGRMQ